MRLYAFFLATLFSYLSCSDSIGDNFISNYGVENSKKRVFECNGLGNYYNYAKIDNQSWCVNEGEDSFISFIGLRSIFSTYSPSIKVDSNGNSTSGGIIPGSSYRGIGFGINVIDPDINPVFTGMYFYSIYFPDTSSLLTMAKSFFVEGKQYGVNEKIGDGDKVDIVFYKNDFIGQFKYDTKSAFYGDQKGSYLKIDKVNITEDDNFYIYEVEISYQFKLYTDNQPERVKFDGLPQVFNLWADVTDGKCVGLYKIKK